MPEKTIELSLSCALLSERNIAIEGGIHKTYSGYSDDGVEIGENFPITIYFHRAGVNHDDFYATLSFNTEPLVYGNDNIAIAFSTMSGIFEKKRFGYYFSNNLKEDNYSAYITATGIEIEMPVQRKNDSLTIYRNSVTDEWFLTYILTQRAIWEPGIYFAVANCGKMPTSYYSMLDEFEKFVPNP